MTTLRDIRPTNQIVPAGFERLAEARDRQGETVLLAALQSGQVVSYEFRPEDGELLPVGDADWRSQYGEIMLRDGYKSHYFSPDMPQDPANPRDLFSYGWDWRLLLIKLDQQNSMIATKAPATTSKGGRPGKWDWEGAAIEMARYSHINDENIPSRTDLKKVVEEWFVKSTKDLPVDSEIRDHVKRFHEALWPPRT